MGNERNIIHLGKDKVLLLTCLIDPVCLCPLLGKQNVRQESIQQMKS